MTLIPSTAAQAARPRSLGQVLTRQASLWSGDLAYKFLAEDGAEQQITFGELDARARAIGATLANRLRPGDRAMLVFPAGLDFIASFFGCMYAGVVAVPATYPKPKRPLARMSRIAEDSGATLALTTGQTLQAIDFDQQDDAVRRLDWLAADEVDAASGFKPVDASGEDLAFLQYTSGSTSEPKGVMVSHGNLLANLEAIRVSFGLPIRTGSDGSQTGVFWLPAYHDMGLIGGVLTPLYVGGPSILMAPTTFLKRPVRWLQAISDHHATISGAPNFAYELCTARVGDADRDRLDLSAWRLAFCGAEPIKAATLREFADAFEPAGFHAKAFYPCYGLAESTLLASGPSCDDPPTLAEIDRESLRNHEGRPAGGDSPSVELVGCGAAPADHRVEIVSPTSGAICEDGQVGEIFLQGPSVAGGYWNRPEESVETFGRTVDGLDGTFLRTGDLGFRYRGELFVTGRVKDVIILRGRNHYPQDIEQTAQESHEAVLPGAAFTIDPNEVDSNEIDPTGDSTGEGEEQLVLVHQIDRSCRDECRAAAAEAIRRAVLSEHELDPWAIVLIRQTSLPITSSGKVQRSQCRNLFLAGELKSLHEWRRKPPRSGDDLPPAPSLAGLSVEDAADAIIGWMAAWLTSQADIDTAGLDPQQPFADLGLDSLTAVELSTDLEEAFGVPLPPVVAWNYPTPAALAGYLAEKTLGEPDPAAATALDLPAADSAASDVAANEDDLAAMLEDIERLSDEDARRLLAEE
ncbi:MAG: AMP-binding protein [Planctomycetota bacterium]